MWARSPELKAISNLVIDLRNNYFIPEKPDPTQIPGGLEWQTCTEQIK